MREQLQEIWEDLRDRRLWPVAALLAICLVAAPVVLVQPAEEAPSQAASPGAPARPGDPLARQAVVKVIDNKPLTSISKLDKFTSKDPFKPLKQLKPADKEALVAVTGGAEPGEGGGGATGGTGGTTGGGGLGGGVPGGTPGTETPDQGGGGEGETQKFTYTVDLTFVEGDDTERHKSFDRLGMLPSESSPLLVFLGVDSTGTQAAFMVDASLQATEGEGTCKPSPASCGVVYLEPGEEQSFKDADGQTYMLRIDQIRQERVEAKGSARGASARTAVERPARRFVFPVLIDMEIGGHE